MQLTFCTVPVAPLRKDPAHRSEMVSQLLFGEYAEVLASVEGFVKLRCLYDSYEGWCQFNQLQPTDDEDVILAKGFTQGYVNELAINGASIQVPYGCPMYSEDRVPATGINYLDTVMALQQPHSVLSTDAIQQVAFRFLNTGYLWGGKSIFGIDCSGFTQQVFKFFGVVLFRDAYLQQGQGEIVENVARSAVGDLAFFQNEAGKVTHVGIVLNEGAIIHASGRVRIDQLDEEGIMTQAGERTHRMHSLRRYTGVVSRSSV